MTTDRRYYISVETDFFTHPKVAVIGRELAFKHLAAIAWCHQHLTDGFVPEASVPDLHIGKREVATLVRAGFWEIAPGGWRIHDYLRHQPGRAEMRKRSQVGKHAAAVRWGSDTHAEGNAERMRSASEGHSGTHAEAIAKPMPSYSQSQTYPQSDSSRTPVLPREQPKERTMGADRSRDQARGRGGLRSIGSVVEGLESPKLDLVAMVSGERR